MVENLGKRWTTRTVTSENFTRTVDRQGIVLLAFWIDKGGVYRNFRQVFEEVAGEYPNHRFGLVNIETNRKLVSRLKIRSEMNVLIFLDGLPVYRHEGYLSKSVLKDIISQIEERRGGALPLHPGLSESVSAGHVQPVTGDSLQKVIDGNKIVILYFWIDGWGPSRRFNEPFKEIPGHYPDYFFGSINMTSYRELAKSLQVESAPSLVMFREGACVYRHTGALPTADVWDLVARAQSLTMLDGRQKNTRRQVLLHNNVLDASAHRVQTVRASNTNGSNSPKQQTKTSVVTVPAGSGKIGSSYGGEFRTKIFGAARQQREAIRTMWSHATMRHDEALTEYGQWELDPVMLLKFPALWDYAVPENREFFSAMESSILLRGDEIPGGHRRPDTAAVAIFDKVSKNFSDTWTVAQQNARRTGKDRISDTLGRDIDKALKLLNHAAGSATDLEAAGYLDKAVKIIHQLADRGVIPQRAPAVAALEERRQRAIESSTGSTGV